MQFNTRYKLCNYGFWTTGILVKEERGYKGNLKFVYEFYIGNNKYRGDASGIALLNSAGRDFVGKSFPIVYYSKDPNISKILIVPSDFKYCNREYPDSLNWVLEYLK
ncbi:hypothetical protein GCM10022209_35080 [Chitinophaga oryziterrae]